MTATYYGTVDGVRTATGIEAGDIGSPDDLNESIEALLVQIADLMDRRMGKSYLSDDPVPPGLNLIAQSIAADVVREMVVTRQTPVVRIDDFALRIITSRLLSDDMKRLLDELYSDASGAASIDVGQVGIAGAQVWLSDADLDAFDGWPSR